MTLKQVLIYIMLAEELELTELEVLRLVVVLVVED
jgi:hypothetical protein